MLVEFGKAGWINKARQQPDKVRQAVDKMKTDGLEKEGGLGFLIEYPGSDDMQMRSVILNRPPIKGPGKCVIGFIGAGTFAGGTLILAFKQTAPDLRQLPPLLGLAATTREDGSDLKWPLPITELY